MARLRPTHGKRGFLARKTFCGREEASACLEAAYGEQQALDAYRVLVWYGVGGQGKSALLREFERFLENRRAIEINMPSHRRVAWAKVDFDHLAHRTIDQALLSVRLQLASRGRMRFPAFDTALGRYIALTNPGVDLRKAHPELFLSENELLADLLGTNKDAAELVDEAFKLGTAAASYAVPGANLLYKYGTRLTGWAREWWDRRGKTILEGLDELRADQLLEKLPTLLGADIAHSLADGHARRIVVLLDTYEALWRDRGLKDSVASLRVDAWVRHLIQDMPGVLVVVASRDRLRWSETNAEWGEVIAHHPLDALSDADADAFLRAVPIDDATIRARIIANAAGLPFYLNLQAESFEDMTNAGQTPEPDQFGRTEREVLTRFLDHLSSDDELILRLAAYPLALSEVILAELAQRFLGGSAFVNWHRFETWSFITVNDDGTAAMHPLMQTMLLDREMAERPAVHREITEWLFARADALLEDLDPLRVTGLDEARTLVAFIYHIRLNPRIALNWLDRRGQPLERADRWQAVARLWGIAASVAEQLFGEGGWLLAYVEYRLASTYHALGWYGDAEALLAHARQHAAADTSRPEGIDDLLERLQIAIELDTGRYAEVERRWERYARDGAGRRRGAADPLLWNRANLLLALDRHDAARASFRAILRQCRRVSDRRGTAFALHGLGFSYLQTGRFGLAERNLRKAIATRDAIGETQSHTASISLHALARVYLATGRHDQAEVLLGTVMGIQQETVGEDHPHHARAHHHLGQIAAHRGEMVHARSYFERARAIFVAANLPKHHHWMRETDAALAALPT